MIRTARLVLRRPRADDAGAVADALADPSIARALARVPSPYTRADAEAWLSRVDEAPLLFAITLDDRLVGAVEIAGGPQADGELGYWLARSHWGAGFATEAAVALVAHGAAMGVRTLVATPFHDNPASARVLAKAGFIDTGRDVAHYSRARDASVPARLYRWTAG